MLHTVAACIANCSRLKNFVVVELDCNSLENTHGLYDCMVVLHDHTVDFTGKLAVATQIQSVKPQNFSTSNDLQYI